MMFSLHDFKRESHFLFRRSYIVLLLLSAAALSGFAVYTGLSEVAQQQQSIARLLEADRTDRLQSQAQQSEYGAAAYYSFHLTYSPPSDLAFAALGERDTYPWKHRIRMLALEGQIYESDVANPELAQAGRIDFAFVISVLAPLFVILLLHDLRAAERSAGRYDLLSVTAPQPQQIWLVRALVIVLALSLALLVPFWLGAWFANTAASKVMLTSLLSLGHLLFWAVLCFVIGRLPATAPKLASALLGIWLVSTFIVPVAGDAAIQRLIDSPRGGDILLIQREAVNDAWDLPASTTFAAFTAQYPQWRDHTAMQSLFEWKWFYAFQQVGDMRAAPLAAAYRQAARDKYDAAAVVSWLSPAIWVQRQLTRLADTDALAAFAYEQQIRDFHAALRQFYYPLLFNAVPFSRDTLDQLPEFQANSTAASLSR